MSKLLTRETFKEMKKQPLPMRPRPINIPEEVRKNDKSYLAEQRIRKLLKSL